MAPRPIRVPKHHHALPPPSITGTVRNRPDPDHRPDHRFNVLAPPRVQFARQGHHRAAQTRTSGAKQQRSKSRLTKKAIPAPRRRHIDDVRTGGRSSVYTELLPLLRVFCREEQNDHGCQIAIAHPCSSRATKLASKSRCTGQFGTVNDADHQDHAGFIDLAGLDSWSMIENRAAPSKVRYSILARSETRSSTRHGPEAAQLGNGIVATMLGTKVA